MLLACRNLSQDKTRLTISVIGIALALMLILLLNGFLTGLNQQVTSYLSNSPGSLVVAQKGIRNMLGATSLLPQGVVADSLAIEGVEKVIPILSQFVILDLHDKKQPAYLIGYDPLSGGGPWQLAEGREPQTDSEIVFDEVLANRHNLKTTDVFKLMGETYTIVGLSKGTSSWMTSFIFVRKTAVEKLLRIPETASFLLVGSNKGVNLEELSARFNQITGINAVSKTEMAANDISLFSKVFSVPLRLMVAISFLIGTMVVGLVIYTATVERQKEYGVLKAIGASNGTLYRVVVFQALIAALVGSAAGVLFAFGLAKLIMVIRPQFLIVLNLSDVAWTLVTGIIMALAAGFFPARVVARLAPATVFRK